MSNDTTWLRLEQDVLALMLRGEHEALNTLRFQLESATPVGRHYTGVGFWLDIKVPATVPRLADRQRIVMSNVGAKVPSLERGVGFVLFIDDGALSQLEGFTYDEDWPASLDGYSLVPFGDYSETVRALSRHQDP